MAAAPATNFPILPMISGIVLVRVMIGTPSASFGWMMVMRTAGTIVAVDRQADDQHAGRIQFELRVVPTTTADSCRPCSR